MVSYYRYV